MSELYIFDDLSPDATGLNPLSPMADLRPSYAVRIGALSNLERIGLLREAGALTPISREELRGLEVEPFERRLTVRAADSDRVLAINGRCVLPPPEIDRLEPGQVLLERGSGSVVALAGLAGSGESVRAAIARIGHGLDDCPADLSGWETVELARPVLLGRPWHFRRFFREALETDLRLLAARTDLLALGAAPAGCCMFGTGALHVHPSVQILPGVIFDLGNGDIVIDAGAIVRPGAILIGPLYVGEKTTLADRCLIKGPAAFGSLCRIAGEVGGTIVQGRSNKAHDGHLGDSWLGEWVNLGAGAVNSNLLNTYGQVRTTNRPGMPAEDSGEQFLGAILGDHVKLAIGTRVMTGAVVNTGTMYAATAPLSGCLAPFRWITDAGSLPYRYDKFEEVARTVLARRGVELDGPYRRRLEVLHRQSAAIGGAS